MLTVQEAGALVRLGQWAIYRAIRRGELAAYKPGGRLRIREADLNSWLESTRVRAEAWSAVRPVRAIPPGALGGGPRTPPAAGSVRARVRTTRGKRKAA
jgi:excisionase family DNA binding protein